jgi:hypothetical protein
MRRIALALALLLAVASPAAAIDLGRLLPLPDLSLPAWIGDDTPATPADAAASRADADAEAPPPGGKATQGGKATTPDATAPARRAASRKRGWRSLLPGAIK